MRSGDTLQKISKRYYGTFQMVDVIVAANGMGKDDPLKLDLVLRIPPDPRKSSH